MHLTDYAQFEWYGLCFGIPACSGNVSESEHTLPKLGHITGGKSHLIGDLGAVGEELICRDLMGGTGHILAQYEEYPRLHLEGEPFLEFDMSLQRDSLAEQIPLGRERWYDQDSNDYAS